MSRPRRPSVSRVLVHSFADLDTTFQVEHVNGDPGIVVRVDGRLVAVIALGVVAGRVTVLHAVGNPDKLGQTV